MEKKYIDSFFKGKLEHRDIPFSEEAWFAAEKLIEAEEQKRRWGGLGRFWFLLPFLISGVLIYVYQTQSLDIPFQQNTMSVTTLGLPAAAKSLEQATYNSNEAEINSIDSNNSATSENNALPEGDASAVVAGTAEIETVTPEANGKADFNNNTNTNVPLVEPANQITPTTPVNEATPVQKTKKEPMAVRQEESINLLKGENSDRLSVSELLQNNNTIALVETEETAYEKSAITTLDIASTDFQIEPENAEVKHPALQYYKRNRFSVGLLAGFVMTPSFNDQIIGLSGANIGGTVSYRMNARWSVNADLLYELQGRNYAFANGNNSLNYEYQSYGFGVDDNVYNVKVKQSHLITLPLYFKYHTGRHSIDVGMQLAYTMALRGKIEEETISQIQEVAITREAKTTWVDSDKITPMQFNVMLGYQFALTNRLSFGLRTVIVPSRLPQHGNNDRNAFNALEIVGLQSPDTVEGEKAPIPLFAYNAINFNFNVQYNLNPKVRQITKPLLEL